MPETHPDLLDQRYANLARRPLYALVMIIPLLAFFHAGAMVVGQDELLTGLHAHRDLADSLEFFGATGLYLPAVAVLGVLLGQHLLTRHPWRPRLGVVGAMFLESAMWVLPMLALAMLIGRLAATDPLLTDLTVAVGAGIYEEFIFRLLLITLTMLFFVDVLDLPKHAVAAGAVLISAVVFSLYHPEVWEDRQVMAAGLLWNRFAFRALAGVYLAGLYLLRGFGIAVGAHVLYNVYVALSTT